MTNNESNTDSPNDEMVLFRCTECGKISTSLGWLHAHVDNHRGIFGLNFPWRYGDFDALMELTEVLHITDPEAIPIDQVCRDCEGEARVGLLRKRDCPACGGTGVNASV